MNNRWPDFMPLWVAQQVKRVFLHGCVVFCVLISFLPCCNSPPTDCVGSFRGSGTIKSPNYPLTYPANYNCEWYLLAHGGNQILLSFEVVEIDITDALHIYDDSTWIRRLSGSHKPFNLTLGPRVKLRFTTDLSIGNGGFLLKWVTVSTCLPGEYYNGFSCMPCTEGSTYVSRKVRNCSQDSDAVYAEPGSDSYSPSDVIHKNSGAVPQEEPHTETTDVIHKKKAQPSGAVPQQDHTETTVTDSHVNLKIYAAPIMGGISVLALLGVVLCLCVEHRRNRPNER